MNTLVAKMYPCISYLFLEPSISCGTACFRTAFSRAAFFGVTFFMVMLGTFCVTLGTLSVMLGTFSVLTLGGFPQILFFVYYTPQAAIVTWNKDAFGRTPGVDEGGYIYLLPNRLIACSKFPIHYSQRLDSIHCSCKDTLCPSTDVA